MSDDDDDDQDDDQDDDAVDFGKDNVGAEYRSKWKAKKLDRTYYRKDDKFNVRYLNNMFYKTTSKNQQER